MTFPCNEVSSRTAGPLFKSCRVARSLASCRGPCPPSKPEFYYPLYLPFYRKLPVRITARNRRRTRTFFSSQYHLRGYSPYRLGRSGIGDRKSFRLLDGVVRPQVSRPRDKHRGWQIFALHATRSERWLAVGPAWDRALGAPLFPETSVGADKGRVGGCIVDRGPRICAGYHHPARPTDWTHFLVSKRKKTPRGEEGVERRYAAASDLQGFVQGRSEDSDSQLQER